MWIENMLMALSAIRANKMRSFLTMLGIIIGIGSVISIVSIGDTMRGLFADIYDDVGVTQAYINIGYWMEETRTSDYFTLDDLDRYKEVFGDEIAYVDSDASTTSEVHYGKDKMSFELQGIDYNYRGVQSVEIISGRYLNQGDILSRNKNMVIEDKSAEKLFGTKDAVGKRVRTTVYGATDEYTIIGVYHKEVSAFQALLMGSGGDTGKAYIPYTILTWPNDTFYYLHIYAADDIDLNDFYTRLVAYVAKTKERSPEDFRVYSAQEEMGNTDALLGGLSMAVGGIAAISLLVGGIGIMNIMLVSVTERTREIGIRKSLGAKTKDIMVQFLIESAILSACGGIIGILMGTSLVLVGGSLLGVNTIVKLPVILLAVGFSGAVGIFFGIYPASKAAKKDPIEALRYE